MGGVGVTLLRGLPASGKSTYAHMLVSASARTSHPAVRTNRDDVRRSLFGDAYDFDRHEDLVRLVQRDMVRDALRRGWDVIVDDTNLKVSTCRDWADLADSEGAGFIVDDSLVATPVEECIRRDAARPEHERVGADVIRDFYRRYLRDAPLPTVADLAPPSTAPYVVPENGPDAVLVDVDGTVADHTGLRDPYDTTRYHLDRPVEPIVDLVRTLSMTGCLIVFCSGRSVIHRPITQWWLDEHVGVPYDLHMRPAGDDRQDAVVKLDLFDRHVRDHYRVRLVLDDRQRVVDAWRRIGLTVAQVADGAF